MTSKSTSAAARDYYAAFLVLSASRIWLSLIGLWNSLKHDQLLSSPMTTFSQCTRCRCKLRVTNLSLLVQEGIYLFRHDIDPYSGGSFRHVCSLKLRLSAGFDFYLHKSPLLLSLFTTILPSSGQLASLLWTINDLVGAYALVQISRSRQNLQSSSRDTLVAAS